MLAVLYAVVCYPVSGILWCWHQFFGAFLDPNGGACWALAVVFLVLTLRALLVRLALAQLRSTRALQGVQPKIRALRDRHAHDRRRMASEMQRLQREHGISPLGGCLPALAQVPVFLGLLHVLQGFTAGGPAYVFDAADVASFLHARLFSAPLAAYIRMPAAQLTALGPVDRWQVAAVAIPLSALAALATYLTSRTALRRSPPADPQAAVVGRLTLYVLPAGALVGGILFGVPGSDSPLLVSQQRLDRHPAGPPSPVPRREVVRPGRRSIGGRRGARTTLPPSGTTANAAER